MPFKRASADVERSEIQSLPHRLRDLRHLPKVTYRKTVPDHQHLERRPADKTNTAIPFHIVVVSQVHAAGRKRCRSFVIDKTKIPGLSSFWRCATEARKRDKEIQSPPVHLKFRVNGHANAFPGTVTGSNERLVFPPHAERLL